MFVNLSETPLKIPEVLPSDLDYLILQGVTKDNSRYVESFSMALKNICVVAMSVDKDLEINCLKVVTIEEPVFNEGRPIDRMYRQGIKGELKPTLHKSFNRSFEYFAGGEWFQEKQITLNRFAVKFPMAKVIVVSGPQASGKTDLAENFLPQNENETFRTTGAEVAEIALIYVPNLTTRCVLIDAVSEAQMGHVNVLIAKYSAMNIRFVITTQFEHLSFLGAEYLKIQESRNPSSL